jgi:tellurite methyltransferase
VRARDFSAVDLGCGNGYDVMPLLRIGATVTAIDRDPKAISKLKLALDNEGLSKATLINGSIERENWGTANLINSHAALNFCERSFILDELWPRISSSLALGGVFCGTLFTPNDALISSKIYGFTETIFQNEMFGLRPIVVRRVEYHLTDSAKRSVLQVILKKFSA